MNQTILEYFSLPGETQSHWVSRIEKTEWRAGAYLHLLLSRQRLKDRYGQNAKLYLLTRGSELLAFCTLSEKDEIADDSLHPWIGFVYTFPEHRGHRYSQILIDHACAQAREQGFRRVYLTSNEIGLYEKYGFRFLEYRATIWNEITQMFVREL